MEFRLHYCVVVIVALSAWSKPHSISRGFASSAIAGQDELRKEHTFDEELLVTPRTTELLIATLRTGNRRDRVMALEALAQYTTPDASVLNAVRDLMRDSDPAVRAQAIVAIDRLFGASERLSIARAACLDAAVPVAARALQVVGESAHPDAFAALVSLHAEISPRLHPAWAAVLENRPEPVPREVMDHLLQHSNPRMRLAGIRLLTRSASDLALARRLALLGDRVPEVRAAAIDTLRPDENDAAVAGAVLNALEDPSPFVRRAALEFFKRVPPALDRIAHLIEDSDSTVRQTAVGVVAKIRSEQAVDLLLDRLTDKEVLVARAASHELAAISGTRVETALVGNLGHEMEQVVIESARALGLMKSAAAIDPLCRAAESASPPVRQAIYEALGHAEHSESVPWLLGRVAAETGFVRAAINNALGRIGDRRSVPHLLADCHFPDQRSKGLNPSLFTAMSQPPPYAKPDTAVARAAVEALGEIGDPASVEPVAEVAYDVLRDDEFWITVARALGQLGDPKAAAALKQVGIDGFVTQGLHTHSFSDAVRGEALSSIARLNLRSLTPQILALDGRNTSIGVRRAAAEVLTSLTGSTYRFRLPLRVGEFFLLDRSSSPDPSAATLPIFQAQD